MDINEFEIEAHKRIEVEIELIQKHMDSYFINFNIPKREIKVEIMSSLHSKIHNYFQHHSGRFESEFVTLHGATFKWHFFSRFPNGSWDPGYPKTLDVHIFLKSSFFGAYEETIL
jgi:hypothetical protein